MNDTFLIITSIASQEHTILKLYSEESASQNVPFILIGDVKSPQNFYLKGCDFYSIERQKSLKWELSKNLPLNHYSRKNLGYLEAISRGAEIIIETDDDNIPLQNFWEERTRDVLARIVTDSGWVNAYRFYTRSQIWPRGFPLEHLNNDMPELSLSKSVLCPIQQGLVNINPDVDAIYRFVFPNPVTFDNQDSIALGKGSICPFNSQNTKWFKEAFMLMYLPSYCSFRMTDIWRSFVAQRIGWTCGWSILFHNSTVFQERNVHNLMTDFRDEIPGYLNNKKLFEGLENLGLKNGTEHLEENLLKCYQMMVDISMVDSAELDLLDMWISDVNNALNKQ